MKQWPGRSITDLSHQNLTINSPASTNLSGRMICHWKQYLQTLFPCKKLVTVLKTCLLIFHTTTVVLSYWTLTKKPFSCANQCSRQDKLPLVPGGWWTMISIAVTKSPGPRNYPELVRHLDPPGQEIKDFLLSRICEGIHQSRDSIVL